MIRFCDVFFSLLGLIVLSPIFVIIALCIVLDSRGGVFYRQVRGGRVRDARLAARPVFCGQGVPVIFQVAQEETLAAVLRLYGEDAHFLRHGQDFQAGDLADVILQHFCVAGVGSVETVVEATEEGGRGL